MEQARSALDSGRNDAALLNAIPRRDQQYRRSHSRLGRCPVGRPGPPTGRRFAGRGCRVLCWGSRARASAEGTPGAQECSGTWIPEGQRKGRARRSWKRCSTRRLGWGLHRDSSSL